MFLLGHLKRSGLPSSIRLLSALATTPNPGKPQFNEVLAATTLSVSPLRLVNFEAIPSYSDLLSSGECGSPCGSFGSRLTLRLLRSVCLDSDLPIQRSILGKRKVWYNVESLPSLAGTTSGAQRISPYGSRPHAASSRLLLLAH